MDPNSMQIIGTCAVPRLQSQLNCLVMTSQRLLIKDISDTKWLSSKLAKDSSSHHNSKRDTLFGMERTNLEVLAIQLTSSQKTPRAPSTSEESQRGRRRVTKLNPHSGQFHNTKICWVSQQMRIYWTLYSIVTLRLAIQINQGQGLKFSLILKRKQLKPRIIKRALHV